MAHHSFVRSTFHLASFELKEMVVLLVVGYSLAYIIEPVLSYLERRGVRRGMGFFAVITIFTLGLTLIGMITIPILYHEGARLAGGLPEYVTVARGKLLPLMNRALETLPVNLRPPPETFTVENFFPSINAQTLTRVSSGIFGALLKGYSVTLTLINLALLPFITYYLSIDFPEIHERALKLFPAQKRPRLLRITQEINGYVSAFVRGQILVGFILFNTHEAQTNGINAEQNESHQDLATNKGRNIPINFLSNPE